MGFSSHLYIQHADFFRSCFSKFVSAFSDPYVWFQTECRYNVTSNNSKQNVSKNCDAYPFFINLFQTWHNRVITFNFPMSGTWEIVLLQHHCCQVRIAKPRPTQQANFLTYSNKITNY